MSQFILSMSWLLLQMLVIAGLMRWASQQPLSARHRLMIWRTGLISMTMIPFLSPQMAMIQLPWLPSEQAPSQWVPVTEQTAELFTSTPFSDSHNGFYGNWLMTLWLLVAVVLVIVWLKRFFHLWIITNQATKITDPGWSELVVACRQQLNLRQSPVLRTTRHLPSPCTWGFIRPVILLPDNISNPATRRMVLLHEMAHIKRGDWLWMTLAELTTMICWFNPFLWWVKRQLINGFETACDELVLQQSIKPSAYAETLLHFHQASQQQILNAVMMAEHSAMYHRLQSILNPPTRSFLMNHNKQLMITATVATLMALTGFTQLTQAHSPDEAAKYPNPPVAIAEPQAAPAPGAPPVIHPDMPVAPARIHAPDAIRIQPKPPVEGNHPATPRAPQIGNRVQRHEQQRREAQHRVRAEQRRTDQARHEQRLQLTQQRKALRTLEQSQLRQVIEQRQAIQTHAQPLVTAEERQLINERHRIRATEARLKAREQAIRTQQKQLNSERLRLLEQQQKIRLELDQAQQNNHIPTNQ